MNRNDFQRNFQSSYFGLVFNEDQRNAVIALGLDPGKLDLTVGQIIPCCSPAVVSSNAAIVRAVFRSIGQTGPYEFQHMKISIKWREDIDENPLYMRAGVPPVGMLQGRYTAWYVSRRPVRNTPRGHCPGAIHSSIVNYPLLRQYDLDNGSEGYQVYRVYNRIRHTWDEACKKIAEGEMLGVVVDRVVALGVDGKSAYTQIYYKNMGAVGYVDGRVPYLYADTSTTTMREYIYKISGQYPEVR